MQGFLLESVRECDSVLANEGERERKENILREWRTERNNRDRNQATLTAGFKLLLFLPGVVTMKHLEDCHIVAPV